MTEEDEISQTWPEVTNETKSRLSDLYSYCIQWQPHGTNEASDTSFPQKGLIVGELAVELYPPKLNFIYDLSTCNLRRPSVEIAKAKQHVQVFVVFMANLVTLLPHVNIKRISPEPITSILRHCFECIAPSSSYRQPHVSKHLLLGLHLQLLQKLSE